MQEKITYFKQLENNWKNFAECAKEYFDVVEKYLKLLQSTVCQQRHIFGGKVQASGKGE